MPRLASPRLALPNYSAVTSFPIVGIDIDVELDAEYLVGAVGVPHDQFAILRRTHTESDG